MYKEEFFEKHLDQIFQTFAPESFVEGAFVCLLVRLVFLQ